MLKRIIPVIALFLAFPLMMMGQVTTSSLAGTVSGANNEPLVGATVTATHLPSGTRYVTISKGGGQVNIQNMRVGGPYRIEISFVGFETDKLEEVYLKLAESFLLSSQLKSTAGTLETVVVATTGRRNTILNPNRTGSVTNIGLRQIQQLPTVTRNLNDFTRATPQSNGAAIGGGNYRQNNFTIDGADFNNSFGIGTNLPAGGSPISVDAIEEISVSLTPFDIRQTGFIGSAINAVTRAGTNNFYGTAYKYFRTEKQRGDQVGKTTFARPVEEFDQFGFSVGGPIIRNKLFFFFNYEDEQQPKSIQNRFASTPTAPFGSTTNIARPTADSLNYIRQYLFDNYDYVTGPFDGYVPDIARTKIMGRIDWNISDKHRFNIRYSQVEGGEPNPPSTSVGGAGSVAGATGTRTDITALWFKNSNYYQGANFYSAAAELNSNFGKFANTLRGTFTNQNDSRKTDSEIFPFVDIMSSGNGVATQAGSNVGVPYTSFGYEPFSFGNLREVKMYSFVDNLSWRTGKHSWTVGFQFDQSETINGFQRFATSYYRFASWADFASALDPNPANRKLPTDFALTYSLQPNFAPAVSAFKFRQYSVYGQDEISINKDLRLTFGLRLDLPTYPGVPQIITHPLVLNMNFENGEKVNTGNLPEKKVMWSPRFAFNWDVYGDRSMQLRGGTGVFTGKIPFVWIVSQSGDNGMIQVTQAWNMYTSTGSLSGAPPPGPFNPNPNAYRPATVPVAGTVVPQSVSALDGDFKNPQSWKTSLAIDKRLPWGMIATFEGIYNKDINTAFFRSPNYIKPVPLNVAGYPDNRPVYGSTVQTRFINTLNPAGVPTTNGNTSFTPVIIDNQNKGYYASFTFRIEKPFSKGLFASIAYTKSFASNLHDGGGDQPLGAYQNTPNVYGLNTPALSYSQYVVPDRIIASLSYRKEYLKHLATTVSFLYQGSIDGRFSYVYGADFNRDGVNNNDLIYIPKDARNASEITFVPSASINGVVYSAAEQAQLFENYITQDKYLSKHRGQYAERNGGQYPWRNQVDFKFMQDIFVKSGKYRNTLQFTLDIFNFGNLLNSNWSKVKSLNAGSILVPQNPTALIPGGTVVPTFRLATANNQIVTSTFRDNVSVTSTYFAQFGLRYIFN
ncbi:MAG: TonB-dependent receptor [Chitinophagaceae bacterium]|nr:TonB-dependent receptor [Chitinophagaceae bacterium]